MRTCHLLYRSEYKRLTPRLRKKNTVSNDVDTVLAVGLLDRGAQLRLVFLTVVYLAEYQPPSSIWRRVSFFFGAACSQTTRRT